MRWWRDYLIGWNLCFAISSGLQEYLRNGELPFLWITADVGKDILGNSQSDHF